MLLGFKTLTSPNCWTWVASNASPETAMLCDPDKKRGGDTSGLIDYIFLMDRAAAEVLCKSYSRLVWPALFGKEWFTKYQNNNAGDGSEHFYLSLAEHCGIQVIEVPLYFIPMQRVGRLHGKLCLHKYCDAKIASKNIPYFHPDMPLCKENLNLPNLAD